MISRSERIVHIFRNLSVETMDLLDDFYAPSVHFEDPLGSLDGLPALRDYYTQLYAGVTDIDFEFTDEVVQGDAHVAMWIMRLRAAKLKGGDLVEVTGNSLIRFDPETNLVIYHRDYFDMGAFVYEHIPVVGWMVRKVKARLSSH